VAVVERTTGRRQIPTRAGGTLPITSIFKEMLGLDTLGIRLRHAGRGRACA